MLIFFVVPSCKREAHTRLLYPAAVINRDIVRVTKSTNTMSRNHLATSTLDYGKC